MKFNYSKLRGGIRECRLTQKELAEAIGINKATLSSKLNGHFAFSIDEVLAISRVLNIPKAEIGEYFFTE